MSCGHVAVTCSDTCPLGSLAGPGWFTLRRFSECPAGVAGPANLWPEGPLQVWSLHKSSNKKDDSAGRVLTSAGRNRETPWCLASRGAGSQVQGSPKGPCLFSCLEEPLGPEGSKGWWERRSCFPRASRHSTLCVFPRCFFGEEMWQF